MAQTHTLTGKQILAWRESENITRQQLAQLAGLQSSRIGDVELGRITISPHDEARLSFAMEQLTKTRKQMGKIPKRLLQHYIDCPPYRSRHRITLCVAYKTDGTERHQQTCQNCAWFNDVLKKYRRGKLQLDTLDDILTRANGVRS